MKKLFRVCLSSALVFCLLCMPAFAADTTYWLDEPGILVEVPSHLLTLTRGAKANNPVLAALEMSRDEAVAQMEDSNLYLVAMDEQLDYMIYVVAGESGMEEDSDLISDADVADLISVLETEYTEAGLEMDSAEIYQGDHVKFAKIHFSDNEAEEPYFALQYHTILDGQWISIELDSYTKTITAQQERDIRTMVDSFMYRGGIYDQQTPLSTPAFVYTDNKSGLTFTVPENWVETPMDDPEPFLDAKFVSNQDPSRCILFSSMDMFSDSHPEEAGATQAEKAPLSRADLNQVQIKAADVAATLGISESEVSQIMLGEKEYFYAETTFEGTALGMTVTSSMTYAMRVENGYGYLFQFSGSSRNAYFQDFEALVSSAQYPVFEEPAGTGTPGFYQLFQQGPAAYVPVLLVLLAVTLAIYGAFPLIFAGLRKKTIPKWKYSLICYGVNFLVMFAFIVINDSASSGSPYLLWTWIFSAIGTRILKKRGVLEGYQPDKPTEPEYNPPVEETAQPEATHSIRFCRQCGNELAEGSRFCSRCGTPVTPE